MQHKEKNVLIAILMLLMLGSVLAVIVDYTGLYDIPFLNMNDDGDDDTTTTTTTTTTSGHLEGVLTSDIVAFDALDIATARTVGTNVNLYVYGLRSTQWVHLVTGDAQDITIKAEDADILYVVASVPSGQNFYVDYIKTMNANSRIQSVEYKDITGDNVEEFVFRYSVAGSPYASGTGKYLMPTFTCYLLTYDDSASSANVGNSTAIGTAKVTKYIEFYITMSAEKEGLAISKVVLTLTSTDITKVTLKKQNIPGVGYLDGSSFDQLALTSTIKWTYTVGTQLYGANYVQLPANSLNKFLFTTAIECDLASSDDLLFNITIYYLDAVEGTGSLTDSLYLQES